MDLKQKCHPQKLGGFSSNFMYLSQLVFTLLNTILLPRSLLLNLVKICLANAGGFRKHRQFETIFPSTGDALVTIKALGQDVKVHNFFLGGTVQILFNPFLLEVTVYMFA